MLKRYKSIISLLIFSMILMSFGCSTTTKKIGAPQTVTPGTTIVTPSGIVTTPSGTVLTATPPTALSNINTNAIMIITDVKEKKWAFANKRLTSIKAELKKVKPMITLAGVPITVMNNLAMSVDKLAVAVKAKKAFDAKVNSNEITRYIADAIGQYKVVIPTDYAKIEYYLRDIQCYSEKKDWVKIKSDAGFIKDIWQSSKVLLKANDKNKAKMDAAIKSLDSGITKKSVNTTLKYTNKLLTISAAVKKEFKKK